MPRKLEVCKFYLNDCCTKRDKCIYMHNDFPCKYHHTPGLTCHLAKNCKFSHSKLDEIQRAVLKKVISIDRFSRKMNRINLVFFSNSMQIYLSKKSMTCNDSIEKIVEILRTRLIKKRKNLLMPIIRILEYLRCSM